MTQQADTKPTCGPLFAAAFQAAREDTSDPLELFSWGHLAGQAEKVYLGACTAAMLRPGTTERPRFIRRMVAVCNIYELTYMPLGTSRGTEFWIFRPEAQDSMEQLEALDENTFLYHYWRGRLCGVPDGEIDLLFHRRYMKQEAQ